MKFYSTAALVFLSSLSVSLGQNSPAGSWDLTISGRRQGLAYMTFVEATNANTLTVFQVSVPTSIPGQNATSSDPRTNGTSGRVPNTNSTSMPAFIWGGEQMQGTWGFDSEGRVIGYFVEITDNGMTNQISFTGHVIPGKRLTLNSSSEVGWATYQGTPATLLTNLSGNYYGVKQSPGQPYAIEFLSLANTDGLNHFYSVQGTGPGYTYQGTGLFSDRNRFGFAAQISTSNPTNPPIRSVWGSFNPRSMSGGLRGLEGSSTNDVNHVTLHVAPE